MAKVTQLYRVRDPFHTVIDGEEVTYYRDEIVGADDPAYRAHPGSFVPLELSHQRSTLEQATAAPGEKRDAPVHVEEEAVVPTGKAITTASFKGR